MHIEQTMSGVAGPNYMRLPMLFSRWHGRVHGGLAKESRRRATLRLEELENRTVLYAGVPILPAPVARSMAVQMATLAREVSPPSEAFTINSANVAKPAFFEGPRETAAIAAANPPVGFIEVPHPTAEATLNRLSSEDPNARWLSKRRGQYRRRICTRWCVPERARCGSTRRPIQHACGQHSRWQRSGRFRRSFCRHLHEV